MRRHVWGFVALFTMAFPAALAAQCLPGVSSGGDSVSLRLRLTSGVSRHLISTMDQTTSQTIMGQTREAHQVMRMGIRFDVEPGITEEAHRIRITYETVRVEMDNPMGHSVYDSSDPEGATPAIARIYSAMVGRSVTMDLAPDGSVTGVDGLDSLVSAVVSSIPESPAMSRAELEKAMKDQLGDQVMSQAMRQAFAAMPVRSMSVGDSWTCPVDLGSSMPVHQLATWTVRSRKDGVITLEMSGDMTTDSTTSVTLGPMKVRYALKGTNKGTMEIDEATSWVIRSSSESDMSGTMTMEGSQMGSLQVPVHMHTRNTTEPGPDTR